MVKHTQNVRRLLPVVFVGFFWLSKKLSNFEKFKNQAWWEIEIFSEDSRD